MRLRSVALFGFFLLADLVILAAHPHIVIDVRMEAVTDKGVLEGVRVEWAFDRLEYSREMLDDYDPNGDQVLDAFEVERLRILAFENAKEFSYFLFLRFGNDSLETPAVENFNAVLTSVQISYSFYLPYRLTYVTSARDRIKPLAFTLKDPTGFFEIRLSEFLPVYLSGSNSDMVYISSERWESFAFNHEADYTGELRVKDIFLFPGRR